ncbi:MAG: helix-turn-helix domain-containing protein [Oscillospiraceae bacterium]|nr:helix-turn-helix domain-containing protein [Oscillospiraceae bacterium]
MKDAKFKNYDGLPLMLSVPDLTEALGISRARAYELVKSEGFPALHIGNRILVPKEELIAWIKDNIGRAN